MDKNFINENYENLLELLNCLKVGVFITDGEGKTILVNDVSCKVGGLSREKILGKKVEDLVNSGYMEDSSTVVALKNRDEYEMIQNLGDGNKVYVTSIPYYTNGDISYVITTERDITETINLRELLDTKSEKYEREIEYLKNQNITMWGDLIAEDTVSKELAELALKVAVLDSTVMLSGESGAGKEVYANFIYQNSRRVGKPFIKVNCAAIPENLIESELFGYEAGTFTGANKVGKAGIFEVASGGTLLLDEIGDLPLSLQPKLLRVLQEKEIYRLGGSKPIPVNVRVIAATNKNLRKEIEKGAFREDLFYRLNVMPIEIPPLRGRKKDIVKLTEYFLNTFNKEHGKHKTIDSKALELLQNANWKGNVRELENIMERLVITLDEDVITPEKIRPMLVFNEGDYMYEEEGSFKEKVEQYEKKLLTSAMGRYGQAARVAEALDIDKATLHRRMKKYGIKVR